MAAEFWTATIGAAAATPLSAILALPAVVGEIKESVAEALRSRNPDPLASALPTPKNVQGWKRLVCVLTGTAMIPAVVICWSLLMITVPPPDKKNPSVLRDLAAMNGPAWVYVVTALATVGPILVLIGTYAAMALRGIARTQSQGAQPDSQDAPTTESADATSRLTAGADARSASEQGQARASVNGATKYPSRVSASAEASITHSTTPPDDTTA